MLNKIVSYPPTKQLSNEEQDYVWKFRFYLSNQKKALAKFLKCVNWNQNGEVRQALSMMKIWAPMDVEDALELLSPNFTHPAVRKYAISRLQQAPDEDLTLYLLQLVQALKYENFDVIKSGKERWQWDEIWSLNTKGLGNWHFWIMYVLPTVTYSSFWTTCYLVLSNQTNDKNDICSSKKWRSL